MSALSPHSDAIELRTRAIGRELFRRIGRGPWPWRRGWWDDRLMNSTMSDPAVKVQLFRFTDVLPSLRSDSAVRSHLREYLAEAGDRLPWHLRALLRWTPTGPWGDRVLARSARLGASTMARKFIAGADPDEALKTVTRLRGRNIAFTADLLGESVISETEADAYQQTCLDLLKGMSRALATDRERPLIDRDDQGPIPRVNLSLKLTSLTSRFDSTAAEATSRRVLQRLRPILRTAREVGAFVNVDMEQYSVKDLTYAIFRQVLSEPDFRDWPHAGIVVQAYLREAERDLRMLRDLVMVRETPIAIRLVKGAYWDYEVIRAQELGWPIPVHTQKWRSDAGFERCARFLMENYESLRPALGSHNLRSLAKGVALAEALGVPQHAWEIQVLHGMGDPIAQAARDMNYRTRVYAPYGAILPGMAYLVRRLLENTSNESFLKASFRDHQGMDELLRDPEETGAMLGLKRRSKAHQGAVPNPVAVPNPPWAPFQNEPLADFSKEATRSAFRQALERARQRFPIDCPALIGGREIHGESYLSTDPGDHDRVIAKATKSAPPLAGEAVEAAANALDGWARTPVVRRAEILREAARILRERRFELAAWEVFECAKPWREADADIAEAIDFCEFYAREMVRIAEPRDRDVAGESNELDRLPRGVAAVIPPWNFPLAIPMGMTVAALVAGNTVVLKPSENAPAMAWHLCRVLKAAGLPEGVLNFLPGYGDVGAALTADPRVALIAFTGSREVGLKINRVASEMAEGQTHVKKVIAEMGGKNAIIVDDDADLDEAVVGVLQSAFGYAGQKCSACSRAIVLDDIYDVFAARLAEAVKSLPVGPALDPDTVVNPVIDRRAVDRIKRYQLMAETEGRVVARMDVGGLADRGNYVGPLIVADVKPESPLAQEEIFGPVLAVIRARDLDDALRIANGTAYALTGGLYSRSPAHIAKVRREYRVGNLYINRTITGALVDRQPFGGFKLSGIGTKAGGPDYLLEFMLTRSTTENTMRRGFAPDLSEETAFAATEAAAAGI